MEIALATPGENREDGCLEGFDRAVLSLSVPDAEGHRFISDTRRVSAPPPTPAEAAGRFAAGGA